MNKDKLLKWVIKQITEVDGISSNYMPEYCERVAKKVINKVRSEYLKELKEDLELTVNKLGIN